MMDLRAGDFLQDRYEIIQKIGSGGMADVYKAQCHVLHRFVAIKILKEEFCQDEDVVKRFRKEAQSAAGLASHPNIVGVYDVVDEGDKHYIVMELIDGCTVKNRILKEGRLSVRESIGIATQVADGLAFAHEKHIVHRDIKPQNMIISKETGKVKVADFGIARVATEHTLSTDNKAIGSAHYISPEQAKGASVDERSDIYSLGISLYEMVTGKLPFDGDTTVAVLLAQVEETITPPSVYRKDIPISLEKIILKCTNKEPNMRYQSMKELIRDLNSVYTRPNDNPPSFVQESQGSTKPISKEDIAIINSARSKQPETNNNSQIKELDKDDDRLHKYDKLFSILGVCIAVILALIAIFYVVHTFGIITPIKEEEKETTTQVESTSASLDDTKVYMPAVTGMDQDLAEALLKENTLQIQITDRKQDDTVPEGYVITQDPEVGTVVDKYSKVSVVVSLGSDKIDIDLLGISGLDKDSVTQLLESKGLSVQITEQFDDNISANMIISYSPNKVSPGSTVYLIVSKGKDLPMVVTPTITDQTEEIAIGMLTDVGLVPGTATMQPSDSVDQGTIISQSIPGGTETPQGTTINYVVSSGPIATTTSNKTYVASIDTTYNLSDLIGPGSSSSSVEIMVRLKQIVGGNVKYTTLMDPRTVTGDTILPVRFKNIEGAHGVNQGEVEVVQVATDTVLKSYTVEFFAVD